jgi:hypothetical protein
MGGLPKALARYRLKVVNEAHLRASLAAFISYLLNVRASTQLANVERDCIGSKLVHKGK